MKDKKTDSVDQLEGNQSTGRRNLLKKVGVSSGALAAASALPENWVKPLIKSVVLPAHAAGSTTTVAPTTAAPPTTCTPATFATGVAYRYELDDVSRSLSLDGVASEVNDVSGTVKFDDFAVILNGSCNTDVTVSVWLVTSMTGTPSTENYSAVDPYTFTANNVMPDGGNFVDLGGLFATVGSMHDVGTSMEMDLMNGMDYSARVSYEQGGQTSNVYIEWVDP